MKSTMLTNWIAPTRKTIRGSDRGTFASAMKRPSGLALAFAQRAELLERRAAQIGVRPRFVADRRGGRLAVVVPRVNAGLFRQPHQPLQALPHRRRIATRKI